MLRQRKLLNKRQRTCDYRNFQVQSLANYAVEHIRSRQAMPPGSAFHACHFPSFFRILCFGRVQVDLRQIFSFNFCTQTLFVVQVCSKSRQTFWDYCCSSASRREAVLWFIVLESMCAFLACARRILHVWNVCVDA